MKAEESFKLGIEEAMESYIYKKYPICYPFTSERIQFLCMKNYGYSLSTKQFDDFINEMLMSDIYEDLTVEVINFIGKFLKKDRKNVHYSL